MASASVRAVCARALRRLRSSCVLAGEILLRPRDVGDSRARRRVQRPVGSARCGRASAHRSARPAAMMLFTWSASKIVADRDGRDAGLRCGCGRRTASGTCGRRPAVSASGLAGGDIDHVGARRLEGARDLHRVVRRDAASRPSRCAEMRTDIGLSCGPDRAHRREHLERKAQPVLERAAVFVGALVGERRDEAREQIAVGAVQLEPCRSPPRSPRRGRGTNSSMHAVHVGARHRARHLVVARPYGYAEAAHRAASCRASSGTSIAFPAELRASPWPRHGRAGGRSWRRCWRVHEIDDALPRATCCAAHTCRCSRA